MDLGLKGRRVLVTGSSSGIGEAIAQLFADEGAKVVIHGRNRERAEKVAAAIGAAGVAIGELAEDGQAASVHTEAVAALGGNIEVLINNAGGNSEGNTSKPPAAIPASDYISNFKANALGAIQLCELSVPDMVANRLGRIVNVSSAVAMQPNYMGADYSAAKAALNNYTFSLAGSLRGVNVTANVLSPGVILVDGLVRFGRMKFGDESLTADQVNERLAAEAVFEVPPAGRFGLPRELAMVAALLASPLNGFITGANYRVDGGQVRGLN
ncbi:SDR family NAD(P)-dependent oxidoreductase [Novosphingobium sp. TH158]|uniref:SDR family NAD(P)-dependent oxidoreductase n=1 Tax=Novosphingobium sp. TH158 TaxID=2067455 RepID=UPI000C7A0CAC|nr:SDR family NAD(P)-dependent oxidoreductase [Novosphingobium sp. TH158]PLK26977.1 short-chain dehydrogenase [Novosphingobium sp. TH158]